MIIKYICDVRSNGVPCMRQAAFAAERDDGYGLELYQFCVDHMPSDWNLFETVYRIRDGELVETGITRESKRELGCPVIAPGGLGQTAGEPRARDLAREALERYNERKRDSLLMSALGVRWP